MISSLSISTFTYLHSVLQVIPEQVCHANCQFFCFCLMSYGLVFSSSVTSSPSHHLRDARSEGACLLGRRGQRTPSHPTAEGHSLRHSAQSKYHCLPACKCWSEPTIFDRFGGTSRRNGPIPPPVRRALVSHAAPFVRVSHSRPGTAFMF